MHPSTLLSLVALTSLTTAAPSPLSPRQAQTTCSIAYPTLAFQLISTAPTTNTGNRSTIVTGYSGSTEYVTELHFAPLPASLYQHGACRLQLFFPAGGLGRPETAPSNHKLNFYALAAPASLADTWDHHPADAFLAGTVDVVLADPSEGRDTVFEVNSPACSVEGDGTLGLDYRVEIDNATGRDEGFVEWVQQGGAGVRLLYNC